MIIIELNALLGFISLGIKLDNRVRSEDDPY